MDEVTSSKHFSGAQLRPSSGNNGLDSSVTMETKQ